MPVKKKYDHIHKYERRKLGDSTIFKCMIIGCTHFVNEDIAENRLTLCWRCDEPFVLSKLAMTYRRPHCADCTKSKKKPQRKTIDRLKELLESPSVLSKIRP